ncbi:MAG: bifunctional phosphoribosyl-AMP cyclohydrolase/phosphoribosyl-ATP diphosphatase HisIE [Gemmatimonadaceae bacterium]
MNHLNLSELDFTKGSGMVTVVTQDAVTGRLLMVAHADRDALEKTVQSGEMHYRSRTRGRWHKGATSGNTQRVVSLAADCDGDTVLARVIPNGPACHTGSETCFENAAAGSLGELQEVIDERAGQQPSNDDRSYTRRLLGDRNLRLKKIGEEASEFVVACADNDLEKAKEEAADLFFHVLVALRSVGGSLADIQQALVKRQMPTPVVDMNGVTIAST